MWIGICDDEQEEVDEIRKIITDYSTDTDMVCSISVFTNTGRCIESYEQCDAGPDVLFLDIELERDTMNGIECAQRVNQLAPYCQIVFVTRHKGYALDAYSVEHCYFVTKEQLARRLPDIFKRIGKRQEFVKSNTLVISFGKQHHLLMQKDICFIERSSRHTYIYDKGAEPYKVVEKLDELYPRLHPVHFVRCHKSYIVNLFYVSDIQTTAILLSDGTQIPVSRNYKKAVLAHVQRWAGELI